MTGHGRGEASSHGLHAAIECFSVNRKQGEVAVAASRELAWIEPHVREEVLKRVSRGKVQVAVNLTRLSDASSGLIDAARAAQYLREVRSLQKKLGLPGEVSMDTILAAPGVVRSCEESMRDVLPPIKKALHAALDDLLAMRAKEGAHLKKELERCATRLAGLLKKLRPLAKNVTANYRTALMKRLRDAHLPISEADPRLITEIAIFAERSDISEELARLDSHIAQFKAALEETGPIGRKLEFLVQEMGREWNTTGSKAGDAEMARLVVAAKLELDKLKEQLANIE